MDITPIIIIILGVVITWLFALWRRAEAGARTQYPGWISMLDIAAQVAINAAEQIYGAGHGADKLDYALDILDKQLEKMGFSIEPEIIRVYIENALFERDKAKAE